MTPLQYKRLLPKKPAILDWEKLVKIEQKRSYPDLHLDLLGRASHRPLAMPDPDYSPFGHTLYRIAALLDGRSQLPCCLAARPQRSFVSP